MREVNLDYLNQVWDHAKYSTSGMLGKKHSDEAKAKMSAKAKLRGPQTPEHRKKNSEGNKGRPRTERQLVAMKKANADRTKNAQKWEGKTLQQWAEFLQMDKAGLYRHMKDHGHLRNVKKYQLLVEKNS